MSTLTYNAVRRAGRGTDSQRASDGFESARPTDAAGYWLRARWAGQLPPSIPSVQQTASLVGILWHALGALATIKHKMVFADIHRIVFLQLKILYVSYI